MLLAILSTLTQSAAMRSWTVTNAFVESAELEYFDGDDTTTYKVRGRYSYEYQGKEYSSERISIHRGADNIGSFHEDVAALLRKHQRQGEPITCYLNPEDPASAILYRNPRFELVAFQNLFVLLFGGFGFVMISAAIAARPQLKRERELQKQFPDEPWKWKQEWLDRSIPCGKKTVDRMIDRVAVWCNVVTLPTVGLIPFELAQGNYWSLVGLLYFVVGASLIWFSLKRRRITHRFGIPSFQMASETGVTGGSLAGVIRIPSQLDLKEGCQQRIYCERRVRSGKNSRTIKMWEDERTISRDMLERDPSQTVIPVLFGIPHGASETSSENTWKLELTVVTDGQKLDFCFEVPVFETPASSPNYEIDESTIEPFLADVDPAQRIKTSASLEITTDGDGRTQIVAPMFRTPSVTIPLLVGAVVFSLIPLAIADGGESSFAAGFVGLLALLLWIGFVNSAFYKSQLSDMGQELIFRGGLFGIGREQRFDKTAITDVKLSTSMKAGATMYYTVKIDCDGDLTKVASHVEGRSLAEAVKAQIEQMVLDRMTGDESNRSQAMQRSDANVADLEPAQA